MLLASDSDVQRTHILKGTHLDLGCAIISCKISNQCGDGSSFDCLKVKLVMVEKAGPIDELGVEVVDCGPSSL